MKVMLFTTQFCAKCPGVKKKLEAAGIEVEEVNAIKYPQIVKEFGVKSVPTLVVTHPDSFETFIGDGIGDYINGKN